MPLKTSDEKQDLILKVFDYFETESKRGRPFFKWTNTQKRTEHCLGISNKILIYEKTKKNVFFSTFILYFFFYI
jgi:hypothetical protein